MKKKLYKGTFNLNGQNMIFYRYAFSETQAKIMILNSIIEKSGLSRGVVLSAFDGRKDNFRIEKIKPVRL